MDLKVEAISYQEDGAEVRYLIGSNGVIGIVDGAETITIQKEATNIVLQEATLGNWTLHMFANVTPE